MELRKIGHTPSLNLMETYVGSVNRCLSFIALIFVVLMNPNLLNYFDKLTEDATSTPTIPHHSLSDSRLHSYEKVTQDSTCSPTIRNEPFCDRATDLISYFDRATADVTQSSSQLSQPDRKRHIPSHIRLSY